MIMETFNMVPGDGLMAVLPDAMPDRTRGGIFLPQTSVLEAGTLTGTVIAVGEGRQMENGKRLEVTYKVGDRIIFSARSGFKVELINGVKDQPQVILVMGHGDVLLRQMARDSA